MNKVKAVLQEAGFDIQINNDNDGAGEWLKIAVERLEDFDVGVFSTSDGKICFDSGNFIVTLTPQEIEELTPSMLRTYIAAVDNEYACGVYVAERRAELQEWAAQKAEMAARYKTLEEKHARVLEKYRGLTEHLKYAPEGPGAVAAQDHFESLIEQ